MPKETFFNLPDEKRLKLIRVSMQEFAERPYEQASVTSIVNQAGIAKGSVYQYFENKQDLYFHLIDLALQSKLEWTRQHASQPTGDFYADLREQMITGAAWNVEHVLETKLLSGIINSPFEQEGLARVNGRSEEFMLQLVQNAQAAGQIRSDIPASQVASYMLTLLKGLSELVANILGTDKSDLYADGNRVNLRKLELRPMITNLVEMLQHGLAHQ